MPKQSTSPYILNDVKSITIKNLKKWGYLEPHNTKKGVISWSMNGNKTGSISITVNTLHDFIELEYQTNETDIKRRIYLVTIPSNLGKGVITYFFCPIAKLRCRKLYLVNGYFAHHKAFDNSMFKCQTESKRNRKMEQIYGAYFDQDKYFDELYSKYFKPVYNGNPTKRYLRLKAKIDKIRNVTAEEIERLMVFGY